MPRLLLTVLPRPLKRVFPKRRQSRSKANSRRQVLRLSLSSFATEPRQGKSGIGLTGVLALCLFLV
ncbi:MAG: 50S ribosomal protein L32 [Rikenellaceae bacterium]|nr:50S ribosomal protein L32 [Rikenellaceae bacterium]